MATYQNHSLNLVPSGMLPVPAQNIGRVGQQGPPPQQATIRKHRHDDEEQGKLFVGGLSWDTTQDTLLRYFSRFGDVIDCVVMKNVETGRSRGFGFVTYSDPNNIDRVLASCPHSLDGRTIDPKACNPRSLQKPKRNTFLPKVFLGGLPSSITETDLRNFFSRYGEVCEVVIMYDQEKKKSRGFGFLSFGDENACNRAVAEHFVNIQNKQVEIKRAEPRTNQMSSGIESEHIKIESIDGQEWAILSPVPIANGHPPPNSMPPLSAPMPAAPQTYASWGAPPQNSIPPQIPQPSPYPPQYGALPTTVPAQVPQWGQPPPAMPPPVAQAQHPTHWASPSPVTAAPPHMVPTVAYATPPPINSQVHPQYHQPQQAVYAPPPSTPQPMWGGPPPGPTPPPQAQHALQPMGHPDLYGQHHPMPATSPHQVTKMSGYATYGPPPVHPNAPQAVTYTFQSPPPVGGQHQPVGKIPMHGQVIYANPGEYYPQQSQNAVSPVSSYPQPVDMAGGLGPQRGAMYTQPSQVQSYHPYRRT